MSAWTWIGGQVLPADEAVVSVLDRGLLLGEGVYETCSVIDGQAFALTRHLQRLRRSAAIVGLDVPGTDDDLRAACSSVLHALVDPSAERSEHAEVEGAADRAVTGRRDRVRITVTGGSGPLGPDRGPAEPMLWITAGPTSPWAPTARVVGSPWPIEHRRPTVGAKTTARVDLGLALVDARRRGADEAVLTNSAGMLCEGTGSNVFLVLDGELHTPSLASGCLAGVTRDLVGTLVAVVERDDLTMEDLRRAPEAFLTSSTRDVHPISTVDDRPLHPVPGPVSRQAAAALRSLQARSMDP